MGLPVWPVKPPFLTVVKVSRITCLTPFSDCCQSEGITCLSTFSGSVKVRGLPVWSVVTTFLDSVVKVKRITCLATFSESAVKVRGLSVWSVWLPSWTDCCQGERVTCLICSDYLLWLLSMWRDYLSHTLLWLLSKWRDYLSHHLLWVCCQGERITSLICSDHFLWLLSMWGITCLTTFSESAVKVRGLPVWSVRLPSLTAVKFRKISYYIWVTPFPSMILLSRWGSWPVLALCLSYIICVVITFSFSVRHINEKWFKIKW